MTCLTVENRAMAAFLGLAIGDALGATVEFMTKREIAAQYGVHRDIDWRRLAAAEAGESDRRHRNVAGARPLDPAPRRDSTRATCARNSRRG